MLCTLYVENFDPVFKVLHMPTLQKYVIEASSDIDNIPGGKSMEALLFAMYYAGVTTISPEKCLNYFQEDKESLRNRYRYDLEMAFANVDLFTGADMVTLQALVIFLVSGPSPTTGFHVPPIIPRNRIYPQNIPLRTP